MDTQKARELLTRRDDLATQLKKVDDDLKAIINGDKKRMGRPPKTEQPPL